ncbi:MAG: hypothetical protein QM804_18835 [Propionicimonas sp.]
MLELVERDAPAVVRLRQVEALRAALDAAEAQAILDLASEAEWDEHAEFDVVGTRPIRIGADGSRLVDEHLPLEVAAAQATSVDAALWLIRDVVNLHARHPRVWHALQSGQLPLWRARRFAQYAAGLDLSAEEARTADEQVGPAIARVGWRRLWWLYRAAIMKTAPDRVRQLAERAAESRYVRVGAIDDDPACSFLAGRLDTGDAVAFSSLLDDLADALSQTGEAGDRDALRARAVGVLADPQEAVSLLERSLSGAPVADGPEEQTVLPAARRRNRRPATQVYVHVSESDLRPGGVARVEGRGPVLVDQLRQLTGEGAICLTPVVQVNGAETVADGYEIPARIRAEVVVRDRFEVFPYSSRSARCGDLDHTIPYRRGWKGQTRASNLDPLSRRTHRGKTHGGWQLWQPRPGVFWWRSPRDQLYRVGPDGTLNLTANDPGGGTSSTEQLMLWQLDRRGGESDCEGDSPD